MPPGLNLEERRVWLRGVARIREKAERNERLAADEAGYTYRRRSGTYFDDPVAWAHDCIAWREGTSLTPYQEECLAAIPEQGRVAVRSLHTAGKSCMASIATLWFALTRDAAGADWKVPTTAVGEQQLKEYLWPEIHKWSRLLRWDVIGRDPFNERTEMLKMHLNLRFGSAFALTCGNDPAALEGAHADELLFLFDESKAIPDGVFNAAEGALAGGEGANTYAFAISTPGEPVGRFYDIHAKKPGTDLWWTRHIQLDEVIAAGRVTRQWAEQMGLLWGTESAIFKNRVLGEFAASGTDGVIPLGWLEAANERWRDLYEPIGEDGKRQPAGRYVGPLEGTRRILVAGEKLHTIGADIAAGGEDSTVFALRQGNNIVELRRDSFTEDTTLIADNIMGIQRAHGEPKAIIDAAGIGLGVFDNVRRERLPCTAFIAGEGTKRHDLSGEMGFVNKRAWAWWQLREMLDPTNGMDLAIVPDDRLTGDLLAPKYKQAAGARIQVESKDDIRKRIGRSTDDGDAVVQAYTESGGSWADLYRSDEEMAERRAEEEGVPQPTQKPSRSGGWGSVYAPVEKPENSAKDGGPTAESGYFGPARGGYFEPAEKAAPKVEERIDGRVLRAPCSCGNARSEHADLTMTGDHLGACTEEGCPCAAFTAR
jgi:hypothetical protein